MGSLKYVYMYSKISDVSHFRQMRHILVH